MTIGEQICYAEGNGRRVLVFVSCNLRADFRAYYYCTVEYEESPELNFTDVRTTRRAAERWFRCWEAITEESFSNA